MPTYDYQCQACGHEFELFQQMTEPVKRKCPKCGRAKLQRLIGTGAGVLFKGGGFYETDYRSDSYKKAADAEKKAAEPAATETKSKPSDAAASDKPAASEPKTQSESEPARKKSSPSKKSKRRS